MDWKSEVDAENEELYDKPYSTFSNEDPQRFLARPKYHYVLLGAGVLILIILLIVFLPNNPESTNEASDEGGGEIRPTVEDDRMPRLDRIETRINELAGVQERVSQLENRIAGLEENFQLISEGEISPDSAASDQMKANTELIENGADRLDAMENRLNQMEKLVAENRAQFDKTQTSEPSPSEQTARLHEVKKGDTLYSISRKYDVNLDQLRRANGMGNKTMIKPGQKLKIPK